MLFVLCRKRGQQVSQMSDSLGSIVLLPGLDGTSFLFRPLLEHLTLSPVVVDYPQALPNDYSDLLPTVIDALPSDRAYILLGWSFSGPLALMAAATRPAGLLGIVMCASFVQKPVFYLPSFVRQLARPSLFRYMARLTRVKALLSGYSTPALSTLVARAHASVPPEVMAQRVRATLTVDVQPELDSCHVPILYLGSTRDFVVPRRNARRILRSRADVRAVFIPGPHLALAVNPKEAASALGAFAKAVGAE